LNQWRLYNFDAQRDVSAVVKVHIETQLPEAPTEKYIPYFLKARPKDGTIKGGRPDSIDTAGPYAYLGCEWVRRVDNTIIRYTYQVVSACYVNDPNCPAQPPYEKPEQRPPVEDELARCEVACSSGDPRKCLAYDLSAPIASTPARRMNQIAVQLRDNPIPFGVDMSPLLDAIDNATGASCRGRQLTIGEQGEAVAFGQACRFQLATPAKTPPDLQLLMLDVPNVVSGQFTRGATAPVLPKIQWSSENSPTIDYYANGSTGGKTGTESIAAIYVGTSRMLIAGKEKFCARVNYTGG
jgi:hypothetical protein